MILLATSAPAGFLAWAPVITAGGVLLGAVIALVGVTISTVQKHRNDARTQWWTRMQWGLDALQAHTGNDELDEERRLIGTAVLDRMGDEAVGAADQRLAEDVIRASLHQYDVDDEGESGDDAVPVAPPST